MCDGGSIFSEEEGSRASFSTILPELLLPSYFLHSSMTLKFSVSLCGMTNGKGKYNNDVHCYNFVI